MGNKPVDSDNANIGCTVECKPVTGWTCVTSGTDPAFISTCTKDCGSALVDDRADGSESCDIGNGEIKDVKYDASKLPTASVIIAPNPNYDATISMAGCSDDCKTVADKYACPLPGEASGPCTKWCGDGVYLGLITGFRTAVLTGPGEPVETCDLCDVALAGGGNGCDRLCKLENTGGVLDGDKFKCEHVFLRLEYELPNFCTKCTPKRRRMLANNTINYIGDENPEDERLKTSNSPYIVTS